MATKATGYLELDIKGFDSAIKTAKNLMLGFAAAFGAFKLGSFLADGVKDAINFGKEMQSAGRAMGGFDPGKLLLAQKALEKVGMGAEEARGHIGDFIKEGRNISEIFGGADNYAKALQSAAKDYGAQADVLTRSGKFLQTVFNTMEAISSKVRTFFLTMTEQFVGPLQVALDLLNTVDLAGVGADFGKAIGDAATTLFGLFKNGDAINTFGLALKVAFQEGINYLVGALNYAGTVLGPLILTGFSKAIEFLSKGIKIVLSAESLIDLFLSAAAAFTASILNGLNGIFKGIIAGATFALQTAFENIPGLDMFLKGEHMTFKYLYEGSPDIIPKGFIDSIDNASKELNKGIGERLKDGVFAENKDKKFQKGNVFDTDEDTKKLKELYDAAKKTGEELNKNAQTNNNNAAPEGVLTNFSGSSSRVIADSLAKIGGGGNYLRVGMSLQEQQALQNLLANKQTAESTSALLAVVKETKAKPVLIGQ